MIKYDDNNTRYNTNGTKTETKSNVSLWSPEYMAQHNNGSEIDPFQLEEDMLFAEQRDMNIDTMRSLLPSVVGFEAYTKYYLHQVAKIPSHIVAERFCSTPEAIRKNSERVKKRIIKFAEEIESTTALFDTIKSTVYELRTIESNTRRKANTEKTNYDFNFEELEAEYYANINAVEKELGL